ncbi:MAG: hypothetical protein A3J07_04890 [Candidatus Doudnabacteria bacterium RIFCSPLOWO2_02_FULL_49_13]|uniref:Uncharacterized protein n=1 Tax=Candidatus Doudnabacteria bacterium RIFCSPHIGHO2_12_FULL_48_16 TaxID=1817838 RepID=A0A1F5PKI5_9BACT|nr:MAG: hypothetical protein A3B77_04530 [Candidatus Doudnabacteria bacterium RIFCSPHIGHO2_02_FULL_49_24]OGE88156.1 MAG: hypothetical protein A2760_02180 [Candidatus Doudnabacteria bacterium RIFCSPHIGHO2_01_FULL_50_67]OGE90465.1 MAG: hypothetical protein A3E29_04960 [Candidatus Doudnabacteria bacterium RIFCSPHIGHO2_12_FULL_48_16]OGE96527.1 MAG: hypothetical protein A2990_03405 [Candidatus Doudnabacteria bacterium RIFCSPLOWO2_01_FULL_49_40]OGF02701.1 MAG: hypothetical protein A3J07_04890 [Candid
MKLIYSWFVAYATPALLAGAAVKILPQTKQRLSLRNGLIIHGALLASIVISQYFIHQANLDFPWQPHGYSIVILLLSIAIAYKFIGFYTLGYVVSCLIQEATMQSIAFLLLPSFPLFIVLLLVVPLYVWCHPLLRPKHSLIRILIFFGWGIIAISLFSILKDLYVIAGLHLLLGSWLISRSLLHPDII